MLEPSVAAPNGYFARVWLLDSLQGGCCLSSFVSVTLWFCLLSTRRDGRIFG